MPGSGDLGPGFLRRVRVTTSILGGLGILCLYVYLGGRAAAAGAIGTTLALANLWLLEEIFTRSLIPGRGQGLRLALGLLIKIPLLLVGTFLALGLLRLSPAWFAAGFALPLAVILLKVLGMLLTCRNPRSGWRMPDTGVLRRSAGGRARGSRHGRSIGAVLGTYLVLLVAAGTSPLWSQVSRDLLPLSGPAIAADTGTEHAAAEDADHGDEEGGLAAHGDPAHGDAGHDQAAHGDPAHGDTGHGQAAHGDSAYGDAGHGAAAHGDEVHGQAADHGAGHGAEGHGEDGHSDHPPELPNLLHILHEYFPDAAWATFLYTWQNPVYSTLVILILCVVAGIVYRRRTLATPGGLQNAVEMLVESFTNFILGVLGPKGKEFIPFLGTLFFYIWFNNLLGLIPFMKAATSVFNTTISLGICVFAYVQFTGIAKNGLWGYLHHLMGSPRDVMGWCMVPLMLPLHLIEEVAKPVSLSLRLFGNILGEDVLLGVFAGLGVAMLAFAKLPLGVPLHLPFIFLAILLSTIQALVFTLLASIYFLQMLPHDEHEEEHGH